MKGLRLGTRKRLNYQICVPDFMSVNTKIITSQRTHGKKQTVTAVLKTVKMEKRKQWSAEDTNTRLEHRLHTRQSKLKAYLHCFAISVSGVLSQLHRRDG